MASKYEYTKKSIQKRRSWLASLKEKPCEDCGVRYPSYVMEWHHTDPDNKLFSIGRGSFRNGKKLILAEIEKCVLLCANCHREREYGSETDGAFV